MDSVSENSSILLSIQLSQSGDILFSNNGSIPDAVWKKVITWWNSVIKADNKNYLTVFEVPISDFAIRKQWLRNYWVDYGYQLSLDSQIADRVRSHQQETKAFEELAFNSWEPTSEELNDFQTETIRDLTTFQRRNVLSILRMPNGANFSVPGAGKTSTELVVWNTLKNQGVVENLLVVCPKSAFEAWQLEPSLIFSEPPVIAIFGTESIPICSILLVNYEQLENSGKLARLTNWMSDHPTMLVIDEAHRIKGGGASVRWRGCKKLSQSATRTDLLTGTPMPQGFEDLKNLFSISWGNVPPHFFAQNKLHGLKRGGIFVRTTKDELELPPVTISEVRIPLGDLQAEVYRALRNSFAGQSITTPNDEAYFRRRGKAVFTLLAAATNPGLLMSAVSEDAYLGLVWPPREISGNPHLKDMVMDYSRHEMPPKYAWLANMVKSRAEKGEKVLVWSNIVGNLRALEKTLQAFNPALIYGGTPSDLRDVELNRFRNSQDCAVLLSNPQTLGEGISLHQVCHEAVYVDRSYNAGHYLQSLDRIHRLGLAPNQETKIHFLVSERSIDERVQGRLLVKIDRLARIMNDSGLVSGTMPNDEEDISLNYMGIDTKDLNDLFAHLVDE